MLHKATLGKHFTISEKPVEWISLETKDSAQLPGFGTKRIAKVREGRKLYFTIGETRKGKRNDLTATIKKIITNFDLTLVDEPTTNGTQRHKKRYFGFDLGAPKCTPETLEQILQGVSKAIDQCK